MRRGRTGGLWLVGGPLRARGLTWCGQPHCRALVVGAELPSLTGDWPYPSPNANLYISLKFHVQEFASNFSGARCLPQNLRVHEKQLTCV